MVTGPLHDSTVAGGSLPSAGCQVLSWAFARMLASLRQGRWQLLVILFGMAAGLLPVQVRAAPEIDFKAERLGNAVDIRASTVLQGELPAIWRVLTDYDRYAQFVPGVASSRVLSRQGNSLILEQRGEVNLLWVRRPMHVTLSVVEDPLRSVDSTLISGSVKQLLGRYMLSNQQDGVRLEYRGRIVPDDDDVGLIDLIAIRSNTSRQFAALVAEIGRVTDRSGGR